MCIDTTHLPREVNFYLNASGPAPGSCIINSTYTTARSSLPLHLREDEEDAHGEQWGEEKNE